MKGSKEAALLDSYEEIGLVVTMVGSKAIDYDEWGEKMAGDKVGHLDFE